MIDEEALETLRERAHQQGFLTIGDIRETVPVERISADEIAMLILQLEEAGISVEAPHDLLGASRRRSPTTPEVQSVNLPGAHAAGRNSAREAAAPGLAQDAYAPQEPIDKPAGATPDAWRFVLAGGVLVAIGAAALLLFAR